MQTENAFLNTVKYGLLVEIWILGICFFINRNLDTTLLSGFYTLGITLSAILFYAMIRYPKEINNRTSPVFSNGFFQNVQGKILNHVWIYLSILIALHMTMKIVFQQYTGVSVESDLVYYDAKLFLEGLIPYKDFITREPYLLYITSFFLYSLKSFPIDIFLNFYLLFSAGTIIVLYNIGKIVRDKKLGLVIATLFVFTPFLIKFPSANYQFYGAIYLFFLSSTIFYLLKALKTVKNLDFFLMGAFMGITIWVYRGAIPFLGLIAILTTFILSKRNIALKRILSGSLVIFLGVSFSLLPPIFYYSSIVGFEWFNIILSSKFLLIVYALFLPITFLMLFYNRFILKSKAWQNMIFCIFLTILTWFFFYTEAMNTKVIEKIATVHDYIRHLGYFLLPITLITGEIFISHFFPRISFKKGFILLFNIVILGIIAYGADHPLRGTSFLLSDTFTYLFYGIFILYAIVHFHLIEKVDSLTEKNKEEIFILVMFMITFLLGNLFYVDWLETYVINLIIPSVIVVGILLHSLKDGIRHHFGYVYMVLCLYLFTLLYYGNYNIVASSDIPKEDLNKTISYIQEHTKEGDVIFTTNPTFPFRSDRNLALNITHPMVYASNPTSFHDYDPYNLVPPVEEIIDYLEKNKVRYIIADKRMTALFISERNPEVRKYILENYRTEISYGNINILKRLN